MTRLNSTKVATRKRLVKKRLLLLISSYSRTQNWKKGSRRSPECQPGLIWCYTLFSQSIWISQLGLRCVFKAIIQRRKQWIVLRLLEKVFSFSKRLFLWYCTWMWYLINFSILSRFVPIFHVFLSIMYLLFSPYHVLYTQFFLNTCKGFSL